jgi:hypothetical protein
LDSSSGAPYDSSISPITVKDSIQTTPSPIPTSDTISIAGTHLNLQPVWADSGLVMIVASDTIYKGLPFFLGYSWTITVPSLFCEFSWLAFYDLPSGPSLNSAVALVFLGKLFNGFHPFTFNLAGSIYQGGINVSDQTISFTWNYSSGVTISPLVLQKQ